MVFYDSTVVCILYNGVYYFFRVLSDKMNAKKNKDLFFYFIGKMAEQGCQSPNCNHKFSRNKGMYVLVICK